MSISQFEESVQRLFDAYGGKEHFFAQMSARHSEFNAVWMQDADGIGRVLRAHLAVEHFMNAYLQAINPELGSVENARLGFLQKVDLINEKDRLMGSLKQGLRRLNAIRNRIAHNLQVDVGAEDRDVFLSIAIFAAMRSERAKREGPEPDDPLSVMEQFAKVTSGLLHAGSDPMRHHWNEAMGSAVAPQRR
jgi:hypothetical protein